MLDEQIRVPLDRDYARAVIMNASESSKFYIGSDSIRHKVNGVWWADYATVIVVHKDGNKGGQILRQIIRKRDFDQNKSRPAMRLMNEVYLTTGLFLEFADVLIDRHVEIHLDINPNEMHGSSCVVSQAIGYVRGTCNIIPMIKPHAFAASFGADRVASNKRLSA